MGSSPVSPTREPQVRAHLGGRHAYLVRYHGPDGRTHSRQFAKRIDADRFASTTEVAKHDGSWIDPGRGRILFADWVEKWQPTQVHLRPSSRARDESYLSTHVLPRCPLVPWLEHAAHPAEYQGVSLGWAASPPLILGCVTTATAPSTVNDEIHAPMGGVRDSGWGRTGPDSVVDFTDVMWINATSSDRRSRSRYPTVDVDDHVLPDRSPHERKAHARRLD
jgi:hypothetical protein